jgi:hypothetical protein
MVLNATFNNIAIISWRSVLWVEETGLPGEIHRPSKVFLTKLAILFHIPIIKGRRGRDRMVVGFTTTYAISAYHHGCYEFQSRPGQGVQHYVITFISNLRQVGGFLWVLRFPPLIKLTATI